MQPLSLSPAKSHVAETVPPKLLHAAQQFEALLLNDLLGPVEKTFASIPGQDSAVGADTYQSLGTQALAANLAASGGLGIATKIIRNIMQHKERVSQARAATSPKAPPWNGR
jgi:Rod binding domain-containing protein